jgi:uncharacterized protein DUF6152
MKTNWKVLVFAMSLSLAAPLFAHHSFAAEYDANKKVTLKGAVSKIEWANPHIWIYVDVKDEGGQLVHWQCEGGAPNSLVRQGWSRNSLKPGDEVEVQGFLAKDGTHTANARSVTLPDGKRVFAGSADDGGPNAGKRP